MWSSRLFSAVLLRAVEHLRLYEREHPDVPAAPVVLVTSALQRLLGPLRVYIRDMLGWMPFYRACGLERLGAAHVAVLTTGHITGPTFDFVILLRHRRVWRPQDTDDAHLGLRSRAQVMYVQTSRCHRHLTVFAENDSKQGSSRERPSPERQ